MASELYAGSRERLSGAFQYCKWSSDLTLKPRTSMTKQQARRRSSSRGLGLSSPVPRSSNSRIAESCRLICRADTRPLSSATWHNMQAIINTHYVEDSISCQQLGTSSLLGKTRTSIDTGMLKGRTRVP